MAKFRLKGKFVSEETFIKATFKEHIKSNGLDSVIYDNLNTLQKKIYNGVRNYENKLTIKGRFIEDSVLRLDFIKKAAKANNLTPKEYFLRDRDLIMNAFSDGLPMSKNSFKMMEFIESHNGNFTYKGKPISKKQLLYKIAQKEQGHKTKARKAIENEDSEDTDTDFILVYKMKNNILNNTIDLYDIESLKDMRE